MLALVYSRKELLFSASHRFAGAKSRAAAAKSVMSLLNRIPCSELLLIAAAALRNSVLTALVYFVRKALRGFLAFFSSFVVTGVLE